MATPGSGLAPGVPGPGGSADGVVGIEVRGPGGQLVMRAGLGAQPGPAVAAAWARIAARAGQLVTVPAVSGGGSWPVVAEPGPLPGPRIPFAHPPEAFSLRVHNPAPP